MERQSFWGRYKERRLWIIGILIILALALRGFGVI